MKQAKGMELADGGEVLWSRVWGAGVSLDENAGKNSCALIMLGAPVRFKPTRFTV